MIRIPSYGTMPDTPTPDAAIENVTVVKETPQGGTAE